MAIWRELPSFRRPRKVSYYTIIQRWLWNSFMLKRRFKLTISKTFYSGQLIIIKNSKCMFQYKTLNSMLTIVWNFIRCYQFPCIWRNTYTGRSNHDLHVIVVEDIPEGLQKKPKSALLVEQDHWIDKHFHTSRNIWLNGS